MSVALHTPKSLQHHTIRIHRPASVTSRSDREVSVREMGLRRRNIEAIWKAIVNLYRMGLHPAISVCIRYRGEVVLERAIGHARGNGPENPNSDALTLATPDTVFNFYSGSKCITHLLVHRLEECGLLNIDDRVADYLPEFARHGKGDITLRHVLTHRAGVPVSPVETLDPGILHDRDFLQRALFDLKPLSSPGEQQAYHALTGGFILAEVMRQISGETLPTLLDTHFRQPLGLETFTFGVEDPASPRVAVDAFTGPDPLPPEAALLRRAFGKSIREIVDIANDPRFRTGVVPSGNLFSTANEISRFFEMLRVEGRFGDVEVLQRDTVRRARQARGDFAFDHMLLIPIRYSTAFMLGGEYVSLFGPNNPRAFGHLGFTNVLGWADPEREISVALLNNGKPFLTLKLLMWLNILRVISSAFPRKTS